MSIIPRQLQQDVHISGLPTSAIQAAITISVFLLLTTLFTSLRMWMVRQGRRPFLSADYMVAVSLIFYYSNAVMIYLSLAIGHLGYPMEQEDAEPWRVEFLFKVFYYVQISYAIGMGMIKCSIILFFQRIFASTSPVFRKASWTILGLCVSWIVMTILIAFLNCRPIDYNWNRKDPSGHCGNQNAEFAAVGVVDVATDVMIIILPMPMIWARQLRISKRIALVCVFGLGIFTIAAAIVRIVIILETNFATFVTTGNGVMIWSMVEWGVAIIVANAPMLRPLIDRMINKFKNQGRHPSILEMGTDLTMSRGAKSRSNTQDASLTGNTHTNESTRSILRESNEFQYPYSEDYPSGQTWTIEHPGRVARAVDGNNIRVWTDFSVE